MPMATQVTPGLLARTIATQPLQPSLGDRTFMTRPRKHQVKLPMTPGSEVRAGVEVERWTARLDTTGKSGLIVRGRDSHLLC